MLVIRISNMDVASLCATTEALILLVFLASRKRMSSHRSPSSSTYVFLHGLLWGPCRSPENCPSASFSCSQPRPMPSTC
jgi:hypothetical protein